MDLYKSKYQLFSNSEPYIDIAMTAGEIIQEVAGLTHDKLTYFVRAGYLKPKKFKRGSLNYNNFSDTDLFLVKIAW